MDKLMDALNEIKPGVTVTEETDLLQSGILDSQAVIHLISIIEIEFDIAVPGEYISLKNFRNLKTIYAMINELRS